MQLDNDASSVIMIVRCVHQKDGVGPVLLFVSDVIANASQQAPQR